MTTSITVAGVGLTLDLLLWRDRRQRPVTGARLAEALRLNRHCRAPVLPLGTVVTLPEAPLAAPVRRPIDLFDS